MNPRQHGHSGPAAQAALDGGTHLGPPAAMAMRRLDRPPLLAAGMFLLVATVACAQGPGSEPAPSAEATDGSAVVVTIDGEPLTIRDLRAILARSPAPAAMSDVQRLQWEARGVQQLVDERLVLAEARRQSVTIDPQEVEDRLQSLVAATRAPGLAEFLRATGGDERDVRQRIVFDLSAERLLRSKLTDSAVRAAFEARRREFDGSRLRVSHIVVRPETSLGDAAVATALERAEAIRREILRGDSSFADAARRYSAGPSRHRGGDIGFVARHSPLAEEFSAAVFALAKGDISRPITTGAGIHVATVTEIEAGRIPFETVRGDVQKQLALAALRELVSQVRSRAKIMYSPGVPHFAGGRVGGEVTVSDTVETVVPDGRAAGSGSAAEKPAP